MSEVAIANGPLTGDRSESRSTPSTTTAPNGNAAASDPGSNERGETWAAGLQSEENRALVQAKNWATVDDGLTSYRQLEAHAKGSVKRPGADASAEEWDKFYNALGRPTAPSEYEFRKPTDLPSDFPYDSKVAAEFQTIAHRAGLMPAQAQQLHDDWLMLQANGLKESVGQAVARMEAAHHSLVEAWGEPDGAAFRQNVEYADRAIRNSGAEDFKQELRDAELLGAHDEVLVPGLAKLLAHVGKALYSEDHYATGAGTVSNS